MTYLILSCVVLVFGSLVVREVLRRRMLSATRRAQAQEGLVYQTPVKLKHLSRRTRTPRWTQGAAGFELRVRKGAIQVVGPGALNSWYLSAPQVTIQLVRDRTPWGGTKDWIRIDGIEGDKAIGLEVSPTSQGQVVEAWNALLFAGAHPGPGQ